MQYVIPHVILRTVQVLCATGGDLEALLWHPKQSQEQTRQKDNAAAQPSATPEAATTTAAAAAEPDADDPDTHMAASDDNAQPEQDTTAAAAATGTAATAIAATGTDTGIAGATGAAGTGSSGGAANADTDESEEDPKYPAAVKTQQGWLPGVGDGGVVLQWSHAQPDDQKLEVMLGNAISILDTLTTLSTAHTGIRAMHNRVSFCSSFSSAFQVRIAGFSGHQIYVQMYYNKTVAIMYHPLPHTFVCLSHALMSTLSYKPAVTQLSWYSW